MKYILLGILCMTVLLLGIIATGSGKFVKGKTVSVVLFLALNPLIFMYILVLFVLIGWALVITIIPVVIIFELFIIMLILFVRWNLNPYSKLSEDLNVSTNILNVDKARKLLQLSLFSSLLNAIYSLPIIAIIVYWSSIVGTMMTAFPIESVSIVESVLLKSFNFFRTGGFLLGSLIFISLAVGIVSVLMIYVLTINGTIRMTNALESINEDKFPYLLLMCLPVVNLISNIRLSKIAKKELITAGYNVGVFGARLRK